MRQSAKKEAVVNIPVRADIAGAFSDIAYYLDKYGIEKGMVTNFSLPVIISITVEIDEENGNMVIDLPDLDSQIEGDINDLQKQENDNVSKIIFQFIQLFDLDVSGLKIVVDGGGKIPPASGLGTSSAVGVGVIMALSQLYGLHGINPCELNYITELSMGIMGGKQDYYATWIGGINYFEFSGPGKSMVNLVKHYDISSQNYNWLVEKSLVYFSGISRSSGKANAEPEKKIENDPNIISRIAGFAEKSWLGISKLDEKVLKDAINQDRNNRQELSSIYYIKEMFEMGKIAEKMGYAHRACGAGMGGCLLFFGDPANHNKLEQELKEIGGWRVL